jgi:hypothetical protein
MCKVKWEYREDRIHIFATMAVIKRIIMRRRQFLDLIQNEQKKYIKFDLGPLSCALGTNNQHKGVFLTLPHVTNLTNVQPKLRPDFDRLESHLFGKKKKTVVLLNNIELNGL